MSLKEIVRRESYRNCTNSTLRAEGSPGGFLMDVFCVTFRSVTLAQRGERVLGDAGLRCALIRTPRWMEEKGCGYSLRMDCRDLLAASVLLRQAGISYRKAYNLTEEGVPEELRL